MRNRHQHRRARSRGSDRLDHASASSPEDVGQDREALAEGDEPLSAAHLVAQCSALLRGGVPPAKVFDVLGRESGTSNQVRQIARGIASGLTVADSIALAPGIEWRAIAAAWHLAETSGAPLATALDRIAAALRSIESVRARRSVLLAGPRATVRLVLALPPLALGLGWLLGFDPAPVLFSPLGAVLILIGGLMLAAGYAWTRALSSRVENSDRIAGLEFDLVWIALGAGSAHDIAVRRVVDDVDRFSVTWVPFDAFLSDAELNLAFRRAQTIGMPARPMLLEQAEEVRARCHTSLEQAAERLSVKILLPLGLCVLPSFMVMGVVPVVVSMLSGGFAR